MNEGILARIDDVIWHRRASISGLNFLSISSEHNSNNIRMWIMVEKKTYKNASLNNGGMKILMLRDAGIPKPKVGIAKISTPNAFAFDRWAGNGRIDFPISFSYFFDEGSDAYE